MFIKASSAGFNSGDFAKISINDIEVQVEANTDNHYRGLHMVIVNPNNGFVNSAKVFDTYKTSEHFDNFIHAFIPDKSIVVAACKDECSVNLSNEGKYWFSQMGSKEVWNLGYRESFVFIGISGTE